MTEFFRDSLWTFVGALLALLAILVSIGVYYAQKQRKRITVETLARVPLIAIGKEGIEGLAITFNGQPLERATVVLIRVTNTGNMPILSADFEAPLSFEFSADSKILSATVVSSEPPRIPITVTISGETATLSPHLLNPNDNLTCRILLPASESKFVSLARIAGVKAIGGSRRVSLTQPLLGLLGMGAIAFSFWLSPEPKSRSLFEVRSEELPFMVAMTLSFVFFIAVQVNELRSRVQRRREQRRLLHGDDT